jgi:alanyl-tRNA synthetase
MNQFKNYFLGLEKPDFKRAASVQKCIRASGKHNDLEDVGNDGRHHTFFEMLGNWSFGDYYKKEAALWAWDFVNGVLKLPDEKLWVSIYKDDDEAFSAWRDVVGVKGNRIVRLGDIEQGDEENFWSMGETGPCGPSSEIYYDYSPKKGKNFLEGIKSGEIVELWNLVFMEFNREGNGNLVPLPQKNIDTGLGLERTLAVLQDVRSDYETDLFVPIVQKIEEVARVRLAPENLVSFQVIADHIRSLSFAVADGAIPSNEGRGYVLRRILRRAVRHGRLLGLNGPFLFRIVETVVDLMHDPYSELLERRDVILKVVENEEELFFRTLDRGIEEFGKTARKLLQGGKKIFPGNEAFVLHDTYGFPFDLTSLMAEEKGMVVDKQGFDREMERQRERAKKGAKFHADLDENHMGEWVTLREERGTIFTGYRQMVQHGMRVIKYKRQDARVMIVFDQTPFYGESGGQVGDTGVVEGDGIKIHVHDVRRSGDLFVHFGELENGEIVDITYTGTVDQPRRKRIMANHTATHLLHYALRKVIGTHATQAGSLVAADRLRFDFNHNNPLTDEQMDEIEETVNRTVLSNIPLWVHDDISMEKAKSLGAIALFGEKYGERVRVVQIGSISSELCGGTHTERTGDVGLFKIVREGSISSGVRRIEAVTNVDSLELIKKNQMVLRELASLFHTDIERLPHKVQTIQSEIQELKKNLRQERKKEIGEGFDNKKDFYPAGQYRIALVKLEDSNQNEMRELSDKLKTKTQKGVVLVSSVGDGKVSLVLSASEEAVASGLHAGRLLQESLSELGGKGGGRPHLAQGGGITIGNIEKLFVKVKERLEKWPHPK